MEENPFGMLTFIVAPAILTNASSVSALATSNRLARAIDRARILFEQVQTGQDEPNELTELHARLLAYAEQRIALLVKALTAYYVSVGGFAAASLVSLVGAAFFAVHQVLLRQIALGAAFTAGVVGILGLVCGSALLVWETRTTLRSLREETDYWRQQRNTITSAQSAERKGRKGVF